MLEKVALGQSKLRITRVGIGTAPMGSSPAWHVNWGPQDEDQAIKAIRKAVGIGVNWIDTAPFYGWGRSEEIIGKAIHDIREKVYIFTKCGTLQDGRGGFTENLKSETIRKEVDASLRRLQTDHIDLLQFHDPDPNTPIEDSWNEVQTLIKNGTVRNGGLSNHPTHLIQRALTVGPVVSLQVQYNPLARTAEKQILPFCQSHNIGVLSWGSLAEGFLADNFSLDELHPDDFRRNHPFSQPGNYSKILRIKDTLGKIAMDHGVKIVNVVVAWELAHSGLTGAIIGIRNEKEAVEMVDGTRLRLDEEEMNTIERALS
jgi:aryl-alcohol dehydrogenase-like predicted oxidoreductase